MMKKQLLVFLSAVLLVVSSCETSPVSDGKGNFIPETPQLESDVMTPEVLWSFGRVGGMQVSPDGTQVVYGVSYYNVPENKSYRDLYLAPVAGGPSVLLTNTKEKEFAVQWKPDGSAIGFLSSRSGSVQIWEMKPDGSNMHQLSEIEGGIVDFKYAPSGDELVYVQRVKLDDDIHDLYPDLPKANARLETDLMYRHWDSWHDYSYNHLFIASIENGKVGVGTDIMEGERFDSPGLPWGGMEQIAWSPDGNTLAYTCKKKVGKAYAVSTNSDIYLYDIASGETTNFTEGMMGYDQNPVFSPDGQHLAWESMARDGYEADKNRLFTGDLTSGEKRDRTADFDQHVHGLVWSANGESIFFISDIEATDEIYKVDLSTNLFTRITDGVHNYQAVAQAGDALVAQKVSMSQPAELYRVDMETGADEPITAVNKPTLDQLEMGNVEERWVETTDGKKMLVWVIYPPHFDSKKSYPALLYCQGGPQGTVSQFWSYRWNFQMMAANDYIVVAPNRRGLPGFGQAWNEQISGDYGGQNMKDYLSAIDAIAAEPYVDENRLGAVGASYGGYSTYFLAGMHEKRFKAFISHCGIFNFEAMYTTTEEMWFVNFDMGGSYWDFKNPVAMNTYKNFSPHKFVQNWDTPMLVIHGAKDFRIPYTQGMGAFNAAKMRGIPAQFLYFPDENHWVMQPQNGILWQRVFAQWLDKWLK